MRPPPPRGGRGDRQKYLSNKYKYILKEKGLGFIPHLFYSLGKLTEKKKRYEEKLKPVTQEMKKRNLNPNTFCCMLSKLTALWSIKSHKITPGRCYCFGFPQQVFLFFFLGGGKVASTMTADFEFRVFTLLDKLPASSVWPTCNPKLMIEEINS